MSLLAKEALRLTTSRLQEAGIESAGLDARILLEHILGVSREELLFSLDLTLTTAQYTRLENLVEERKKRSPIAKLIGKREFWGLDFTVSAATLDPRPDSETLIEEILERVQDRAFALKILDLGTGTGCLLFSLLSEFPAAKGVAVDVSAEALEIARQNAASLGLVERVDFIHSKWAENIHGEKFDIIVSNPPYIPSAEIAELAPEVAVFEPKLALDGGVDGLDCYRTIIKQLPNLLAENGFAAFEIGIGQEKDIEKIAGENGLKLVTAKKDLGGIIRCLILQKI